MPGVGGISSLSLFSSSSSSYPCGSRTFLQSTVYIHVARCKFLVRVWSPPLHLRFFDDEKKRAAAAACDGYIRLPSTLWKIHRITTSSFYIYSCWWKKKKIAACYTTPKNAQYNHSLYLLWEGLFFVCNLFWLRAIISSSSRERDSCLFILIKKLLSELFIYLNTQTFKESYRYWIFHHTSEGDKCILIHESCRTNVIEAT